MKLGLLGLFAVGGMAVWVFAAIGIMAVAHAVTEPAPSQADGLLAQPGDVPGSDVAGLPRPDGATRHGYRRAVWDGTAMVEVEYRSNRSVEMVRDHYEDAFRLGGWTVEAQEFERGEWVYDISGADRAATVEIEVVDGHTEIEIELVEAAYARGPGTAR